MKLSIIVAMSIDNVIGQGGKLPWHIPEDLKRFRSITMGHTVIMGRKTYESIGRPLSDRKSIIITRQSDFQAPGCVIVNSPQMALSVASVVTHESDEVFIIGGAEIYAHFLPFCSRMYITKIHSHIGDGVKFPEFDPSEWDMAMARGRADYSFGVFDRLKIV